MSFASHAHFHKSRGSNNNGLGVRVTRLEMKVDHIQKDVVDIKDSLKSLDDKMERKFSEFDNKMERRFSEADAKSEKRFVEVERKISDLEVKFDHKFEKIDTVLCRLVTETAWIRYAVFAIAGTGMAAVLKLFWHTIA